MSGIDPLTLVVVVSFLALLLAIVLAALRASFPKSVDGIGQWALSMPLFVLSSVLFSQQQAPPLVHVIFANSLILLAMVLMNNGLMRFYQRPLFSRRTTLAGMAVILAVLSWFTFVQPSFLARLMFMSAVGVALFGHLCLLPLTQGRRSLGSGITSLAFGLATASCLLRIGMTLSRLDQPADLLDLSMMQTIYLTSFNISLLIGSVGFMLLINERLREILEFSASHDTLTQVLNRGAFFRMAERAVMRHKQERRPLSVALIDLDHFKQINDRHGHAVGDAVLKDFCRAVRAVLRPSDALGRYGGEEFVILLPDMQGREARDFAQNLLNTLQPSEGLPAYTASIGFASLAPDTADIDSLLISADKALYQAKRNGRNQVEEWTPELDAALEDTFSGLPQARVSSRQ